MFARRFVGSSAKSDLAAPFPTFSAKFLDGLSVVAMAITCYAAHLTHNSSRKTAD